MLLALALLFFAAHVVAWMLLPAGKAHSEHPATVHMPEFVGLTQAGVSEA